MLKLIASSETERHLGIHLERRRLRVHDRLVWRVQRTFLPTSDCTEYE